MKLVDDWWVPDAAVWSAEMQRLKIEQVRYVMQFVRKRQHRALIAGAWNGVLVDELAHHFIRVDAFEPEPENYVCAMRNLSHRPNVTLHHALLAEVAGVAALAHADDGLHHVALEPSQVATRVPSLVIDELHIARLDLILLDVEGYEHRVLEGAERTIGRYSPAIIIEENALVSRYNRERGDLARWLEERGYKQAGAWTTLPPEVQNDGVFRGADLVFTRE